MMPFGFCLLQIKKRRCPNWIEQRLFALFCVSNFDLSVGGRVPPAGRFLGKSSAKTFNILGSFNSEEYDSDCLLASSCLQQVGE